MIDSHALQDLEADARTLQLSSCPWPKLQAGHVRKLHGLIPRAELYRVPSKLIEI